jgi:hypothetical protein
MGTVVQRLQVVRSLVDGNPPIKPPKGFVVFTGDETVALWFALDGIARGLDGGDAARDDPLVGYSPVYRYRRFWRS